MGVKGFIRSVISCENRVFISCKEEKQSRREAMKYADVMVRYALTDEFKWV